LCALFGINKGYHNS